MTDFTQTISHRQKIFFACLSILIIPISGLAIDIYAPSLPSVAHYFSADKGMTQLTITSYMLGLSLMQLFAGGISDSFGRRKPFLIANAVFFIATIAIPYTQTIYQLLALRFLQGSTVAATIVPMRSIVPDLFEGRELRKWINYMVMAWSIGPIIAPAIGGYLQHYFGWKSNFYFLAIYTLIAGLMIYFYLPETSQHRHRFSLSDMAKRYITIASNPLYASSVAMNGLLYSILIIFTVAGPFLIQSSLHYSAIDFGNMALGLGLAWFLGTMTNRFLLDISFIKKTSICLFSILLLCIIMTVALHFYHVSLFVSIAVLYLIAWLAGIIFPNNGSHAMTAFPEMTGSANALFGSIIFFSTSITSATATQLHALSFEPLYAVFSVLIMASLIIVYFQRKIIPNL